MKWIIGAFSHETNNFSVVPTDLDAFRAQAFKTGDEIIEWARGTKTPIGGFIDAIEERGDLIIPTAAAAATPSGPVTRDAYDTVSNIILDGISHHRDADGILLALHGAMMADGIDDGEGRGGGVRVKPLDPQLNGVPVGNISAHNLKRKLQLHLVTASEVHGAYLAIGLIEACIGGNIGPGAQLLGGVGRVGDIGGGCGLDN